MIDTSSDGGNRSPLTGQEVTMAVKAREGSGGKAPIPIYEIELDLSHWKATYTHEVPGFADGLLLGLRLLS